MVTIILSIVCIVLMFFFSVSLETSLDSFLGEISPEKQKSSIVSRYSTWQDLGAALGPMVGFIFATNLGISFGYYLSIFMLAICIISFLKIFTNQEN